MTEHSSATVSLVGPGSAADAVAGAFRLLPGAGNRRSEPLSHLAV